MPTTWRQGDLVAPEHAIALGIVATNEQATYWFVVASHSCDIASEETLEPEVELLRAKVVHERQANVRNGHSIRKLHLPAHGVADIQWLELGIGLRESVKKADLLARNPWSERSIPASELGVFRRWLAQRYSRSAFPNAFIDWLQKSGVEERFDRLGKRYSDSLVGIYFDLNDDSERTDADDPYQLGIYLVYTTSDTTCAVSAQEAATELSTIFQERCHQPNRWRWVELVYCEAIADHAFSLRAAFEFRRWRFEHRSISGEPIEEERNPSPPA